MYSLPLLALLPLALTLPNTQRQNQSCTTQQWNIQQFEAFTAGSSLSPGAPSIFSYDHVSFYFNDPNFGLRALCERSIEPGTGQLADDRLYPCDGSSMFFRYVGASITLQRTDVHCGNATYKATGSTELSLECYDSFSGKECKAVTQVNVPVALLEPTGA